MKTLSHQLAEAPKIYETENYFPRAARADLSALLNQRLDEAIDLPVQRQQAQGSPAIRKGNCAAGLLYLLIADQPFFERLNEQQLRMVTDSAMEIEFEPDQYLFRQGDPANRFYVIVEGKVQLESQTEERPNPIRALGPGDDVGWSWWFPSHYFRTSAKAVEPTRAIFFYGTRLRQQCEDDHDLGYEIMKRLAKGIVQRMSASQQNPVECKTAKVYALEDSHSNQKSRRNQDFYECQY